MLSRDPVMKLSTPTTLVPLVEEALGQVGAEETRGAREHDPTGRVRGNRWLVGGHDAAPLAAGASGLRPTAM
jgi:hypothetical protein